ncbi:hypothetical protein [Humibacter sp.]|uniref:hypothetical protein n=1 Tax=Humibacter sp. TaxID=1940291 RepID=UPI003F8167BD
MGIDLGICLVAATAMLLGFTLGCLVMYIALQRRLRQAGAVGGHGSRSRVSATRQASASRH